MTCLAAPTRSAILLALGALAMTGCFTDPINQPPTVQQIMPTRAVNHGQPASFTVTAFDPDHDVLDLTWGDMSGPCPQDVSLDGWHGRRTPGTSGQPFEVGADVTASTFCVCTFVNDSHSAADHNCLTVMPDNRAPTATIAIVQPASVPMFDLHTHFRLSAAGSTDPDGDPVQVDQWTLAGRPPGSQAAFEPSCAAADGGDASDGCFTADQQGEYAVIVAVSDGHGGTDTDNRTLTVGADRMPCLGTSMPDWQNPMQLGLASDPVTFTITSVIDDLVDESGRVPLTGPGARIHFTWYEGLAGGVLPYAGDDYPMFTRAPNPRQAGDTRSVRVEIRDDANADRIRSLLLGCGDAATCAVAPGCFIRATWTVRYN